MDKDEMKNKISFALKDPILQQGFEIICKENAELRNLKDVADLIRLNNSSVVTMAQLNNNNVALRKENAELKAKTCLSIDCDKAQKNGELCLGYGGDEDEPCERCKNCIKCETGYYQLGETDKDNQLTKAKEIIKSLLRLWNDVMTEETVKALIAEAE
jgi:hypothetical protein